MPGSSGISIARAALALLTWSAPWLSGCGEDRESEPSMSTQRTLEGPVGRLHVDDGGQGEPAVVFVHAFGGSTEQWSEQLAYVRKTRRAIALDLRGHGRSDPPAD